MTYSLDSALFVENGPAAQARSLVSASKFARAHGWLRLDIERRLAAVDEALTTPANDIVDNFPVAL